MDKQLFETFNLFMFECKLEALITERIGMQAENQERLDSDQALAYREEDFIRIKKEIEEIRAEVKAINNIVKNNIPENKKAIELLHNDEIVEKHIVKYNGMVAAAVKAEINRYRSHILWQLGKDFNKPKQGEIRRSQGAKDERYTSNRCLWP